MESPKNKVTIIIKIGPSKSKKSARDKMEEVSMQVLWTRISKTKNLKILQMTQIRMIRLQKRKKNQIMLSQSKNKKLDNYQQTIPKNN